MAEKIAAIAAAAARLEAYERVTRAALLGQHGRVVPPVLQLSDDQLAALYSPQQLANLVTAPLRRPDVCGAKSPAD